MLLYYQGLKRTREFRSPRLREGCAEGGRAGMAQASLSPQDGGRAEEVAPQHVYLNHNIASCIRDHLMLSRRKIGYEK